MAGPPDLARLDASQAAALDAVLAVILPSGSGAGAAEAEAGRYVRARLAGADRHWLDLLCRWLPEPARAREAVAALATEISAETERSWPGLFEQLRVWAWSGYLCDPALGGNADGVGWARFDWTPPPGRTATCDGSCGGTCGRSGCQSAAHAARSAGGTAVEP
jgi:hypothetical protein